MSSVTSTSANRITGMVSGMDVDSIVQQLMAAEKKPLEKLQQKQQLAEWKRDAYREITSSLKAFGDKYFNYLNSSSNMLSSSVYKQYAVTSSNTSVVTASGSADAGTGSHTITVTQLATAAVYKSATAVTKAVAASSAADFSAANGKSFVLTVDGTQKTITLSDDITDMDGLQSAVDKAVGSGKVVVSDTVGDGSGYLTFSAADGSGVSKITLSDGTSSALSSLGFSSSDNLCNRLSKTDTLETVAGKLKDAFSFNEDDQLVLRINGTEFTFEKSDTLSAMMSKINGSDAGVKMKYDETSDTFVFTANSTGAGDSIQLSETGSTFLENAAVTDYTQGKDAIVTLDGQKITRSSNTVTQDGVTYTLLAESTEQQTVALSLDIQAVYDTISGFVGAYNELIANIDSVISQEYDRDYPPLTEDQKEEMSEDEITAWEKKAKTGLLENDSILESMLNNMRSALYQSVSGVSANLASVGITTSSNYEDKGKLVINEDTLKAAISDQPEVVMNLFSKASTSYSGTTTVRSLDAAERAVRTSEEGLAYRLYDILQDNISTYRNSAGNKGLLLEKAGMEGDSSAYSNTLYNEMDKYADQMEEMEDKLDDKEDAYYAKFTAMETYINNMNSQLSALQSYLS